MKFTMAVLVAASLMSFCPPPDQLQEKPEEWYDFRTHPAYRAMDDLQRERLEKVQRDFVLLTGALELYADDHGDGSPQSLAELSPRYLRELPIDPFATGETAADQHANRATPSRGGWGYRYRPGSPGNRAWIISSVGLSEFPFLAREGNIGLYLCKGEWISGLNPMYFDTKR